MVLAVELCVASVTMTSDTSLARQVAKKYAFPVGKGNTVRNVSVFTFNLSLMINSFVWSFVYLLDFFSVSITMDGEENEVK